MTHNAVAASAGSKTAHTVEAQRITASGSTTSLTTGSSSRQDSSRGSEESSEECSEECSEESEAANRNADQMLLMSEDEHPRRSSDAPRQIASRTATRMPARRPPVGLPPATGRGKRCGKSTGAD